jgi:hypothetical protein
VHKADRMVRAIDKELSGTSTITHCGPSRCVPASAARSPGAEELGTREPRLSRVGRVTIKDSNVAVSRFLDRKNPRAEAAPGDRKYPGSR